MSDMSDMSDFYKLCKNYAVHNLSDRYPSYDVTTNNVCITSVVTTSKEKVVTISNSFDDTTYEITRDNATGAITCCVND